MRRERTAGAVWLAVAALLPWSSVVAQSAGAGSRVRGVVFDSIARQPLHNATVQLGRVGANEVRTTQSDAHGVYAFSDLPLGTYLVGFHHPRLDSLGLDGGEWRVDLRSTGTVVVPLAIPGSATLTRALCDPKAVTDSTGMVLGRIRSAADGAPLREGTVRLRWDEFVISRGQLAKETMTRSAVASPSGFYAICGVPSSISVLVRAWAANDSSGFLELDVPAQQVTKRDIFVGTTHTLDIATGDSAAINRAVSRGRGRVRGLVSGGERKPLSGARIMVWGTGRDVVANSEGQFQLDSLPTGSWMIEARAIGFVPERRIVDIAPSEMAPLEIILTSRARYLDTVRVMAERVYAGGRLADFTRRRAMAFGQFLDASDIEKRSPLYFSDLMRGMPGVTVRPGNGSGYYVLMRSFGNECVPTLYVDGVRMSEGDDPDMVVWPSEVIAVEVYPRSPPAEFYSTFGCGAIVVWRGQRGHARR